MDTLNNEIIFTRYLYIKDEVEIALLTNILEKRNDAIFWAYELYFSGFENELFKYLWKIYYDFFAVLNPSFESFLLKKEKEWLNSPNNLIISIIIQNLLIRSLNTDVYLLSQISNKEIIEPELILWIKNNNYEMIAQYLEKSTNIYDDYSKIIDIFEEVFPEREFFKKKLLNNFKLIIKFHGIKINNKKILLSKVLNLFAKTKEIIGKSFYVNIDPSDVIIYETIEAETSRGYKLLKTVCLYGVNDNNNLGFFELKRYTMSKKIFDIYNSDWLYYASFSPIWKKRITDYSGQIVLETKQVLFTEEFEEKFYNDFHLEPDEQSLELKNKNIPEVTYNNGLKQFYEKFNKDNLLV